MTLPLDYSPLAKSMRELGEGYTRMADEIPHRREHLLAEANRCFTDADWYEVHAAMFPTRQDEAA